MNPKKAISKVFAIIASIPLWTCAVPATAQRLTGTIALEQPEIVQLTAPQWTESDSLFKVSVGAAYARGISAIEVSFNGQVERIPVRNEKTAFGVAQFVAREVRNSQVSAVAISADGRQRSAVRAQQVLVGPERQARAPQTIEEYRMRLDDSGYSVRTGSTKNQNWPVAVDSRPWWNAWFEGYGPKHFDWVNQCQKGIAGINAYGEVLECWLALNPKVAASISWQELDPNAGPLDQYGVRVGVTKNMPYSQWTPEMKIQLHVAVFFAWEWMHGELNWFNGNTLPPAPANQLTLDDGGGAYTVLSHDDAWNLYLGTIAHSLAVELGGFVPWSITGYSSSDLGILFDSSRMFEAKNWEMGLNFNSHGSATGYRVKYMLAAPPTVNFEAMVTHDMIRPDQYRTVGRYLQWGRDFSHTGPWYLGGKEVLGDGHDPVSAQAYWGYRGVPVAAAIIAGTTMKNPYTPNDPTKMWPLSHWVEGCTGMSYFTQQMLRAVNIPVAVGNVGQTMHTAPFFWTIGYTMSHGDDMYSMNNAAIPTVPGEWLLIPMSTYHDWFYGAGLLGKNGNANVSRQAEVEVPLKSLPNTLLHDYCADAQANLSHANGDVAEFFRNDAANVTYYTVAQLEAKGLWTKLGSKAAALGLCGP